MNFVSELKPILSETLRIVILKPYYDQINLKIMYFGIPSDLQSDILFTAINHIKIYFA